MQKVQFTEFSELKVPDGHGVHAVAPAVVTKEAFRPLAEESSALWTPSSAFVGAAEEAKKPEAQSRQSSDTARGAYLP